MSHQYQSDTEYSPIGPHEGRELLLMLSGEKPLALFFGAISDSSTESGVIPEQEFAPYIQNRTLIMTETAIRPLVRNEEFPTIRVVLYALPVERWRFEEALKIIIPIFSMEQQSSDDDDIKLGRLLGYTEEEISCFLNRDNL